MEEIIKNKKYEFKTYLEMDQKVDQLYDQENYDEAIDVLKQGIIDFPDNDCDIIQFLAFCYKEKKEYQKVTNLLLEALKKKYFYGLGDFWKNELINTNGYEKLIQETSLIRNELKKTSKVEYDVFTPENYSKDEKYPLLFILHGNSQNIENSKNGWEYKSLIKLGYIVVYIQSSQLFSFNGYSWSDNFDISKVDIESCYKNVINNYSVDQDKVILAGFSGGGMASLNLIMNNSFPVKGFIILCPYICPPSFNLENMKAAIQRGVKGVIFEGEITKDLKRITFL